MLHLGGLAWVPTRSDNLLGHFIHFWAPYIINILVRRYPSLGFGILDPKLVEEFTWQRRRSGMPVRCETETLFPTPLSNFALLRRSVRSDAQLSCTETRFQKCSRSSKNGSKHSMLSISMANNVISCKKIERNTQKIKIADFTM